MGLSAVWNRLRSASVSPGVLAATAWRSLRSRAALHTAMLTGSQIASMALGIAAGYLVARRLGAEMYGLVVSTGAIISYIVLFFRFGTFTSVCLLLTDAEDRQTQRELSGAGFVVGVAIGCVFAAVMFAASFIVDRAVNHQVGHALRLLTPVLIIAPLPLLFMQIGRALELNALMAVGNVLGPATWITGATVLMRTGHAQLVPLLLVQQLGAVLILIWAYRVISPSYRNLRTHIQSIMRLTRRFGYHMAASQILDQSTGYLNKLLMPSLAGTTSYGFFSISQTLVSPIQLVPTNLFLARFRRIAAARRVPGRYLAVNAAIIAATSVLILLVQRPLVHLVYGPAFAPVSGLVPILVLGYIFQGLYQPYLPCIIGRRDRRVALRSVIGGAVNVAANVVLIRLWKAEGAAWAAVISMFTAFALLAAMYYRQVPEPVDSAEGAGETHP